MFFFLSLLSKRFVNMMHTFSFTSHYSFVIFLKKKINRVFLSQLDFKAARTSARCCRTVKGSLSLPV